MKKFILSILAIAAMTSCTKTSEDDVDPNAPVEIKLNAGIETSVSIGRSAVNNLDEATLGDFVFFKGDGDQTGTNLTWSYTPLNSTVSADGTITFNPVLYYNQDPTKYTYFIGMYPKSAGTITDNKLEFTPTEVEKGQTDIMYAQKISGNKNTTTNLKIQFTHALSQLKFKFTKGSSFESTSATVTSITIKGTNIPTEINLSTGAMTYSLDTKNIKLEFTTDNTIGGSTAPKNVIMINPSSSNIKADITIQNGEKVLTFTDIDITVTPQAGESHEIELTFEQQAVSGQASITEWTDGTGGTGTVK